MVRMQEKQNFYILLWTINGKTTEENCLAAPTNVSILFIPNAMRQVTVPILQMRECVTENK